jgi:hypothetical protein
MQLRVNPADMARFGHYGFTAIIGMVASDRGVERSSY